MRARPSSTASPILPDLPAAAVGIDVGATLVKLAVPGAGGEPELRLAPRRAIEQVAREVEAAEAMRVGLTGCGAAELAALLTSDTARVDEFAAWRAGAETLRGPGAGPGPYLLVSLGTGTSALLVDGSEVRRVGGTALGGGTLAGLAAALLGGRSFDELAALAQRGRRERVDLLLSDIYAAEDSPLPGAMTAASFAKLARRPGVPAEPEDLASAIVGLVGENVALICTGLARLAKLEEIVFGGSALRGNPALGDLLRVVCLANGCRPVLLQNGEFAGALGALTLAGR